MSFIRKISTIVIFFFLLQGSSLHAQRFYQDLQEYCDRLSKEITSIPGARKDSLKIIGDFILQLRQNHKSVETLFAGSSNGTLSQAAEIWFYTALHFYKVKNIKPFSGGIHPGAINYRIVGAFKRCGFFIMPAGGYADNPVYFLNLGRNYPDYTFFAKPIDYHSNPHSHFLVIPVFPEVDTVDFQQYGAEKTIPCHWKNPSLWDDTSMENIKYDACIHKIGRDLFYLAGYIRDRLKSEKKKKKK